MKHLLRALSIAFVLLLSACGDAPAGDPTYSGEIQPLFNAKCVSCHIGGSSGSYDLNSYAGTMGAGSDSVPNVIAGRPDSSLLYTKVADGAHPVSSPVDSTQLRRMRTWIEKGALNN